MDWKVGPGTDCEGLCQPCKGELGFLCLLFLDRLEATVEVEDTGTQVAYKHMQLASLFAILATPQYAFFSPNNN